MNSKSHPTGPPSTANTKATPTVGSEGASILPGASSPRVYGGEFNNSQRDQNTHTYNRCTLLYIGGSGLDTSRASLVVGETSRSGSVVNTPSDQDESEKSSIIADSGFGGSDACFEIESPPTEQESPVEEETSNAIYKRHMYPKGRGEPLFIPSPNMRLSHPYRRQGVKPGDVGIFTSDGGFDFLFNVFLPAGDPRNPNELPEGFYPLNLKPADVFESRGRSPHSHMASPSVKKKGATFECSGSDGAILIMPQGNCYEDLQNIVGLRDYALTHAESWYEYATGPCGRGIGKAELHLVTGCDKTTSWAIASYSNLQSNRFQDSITLLNFNAVSSEHQGRHPSYTTYSWDHESAAEAKVGPEDDELADLLEVHDSAPLRNQCTFVRSFTLALGDDAWNRLELKVAASAKARASPPPSCKGPFASVLGAISSLQGLIGSSHGHPGSFSSADSMTPAQIPVAHPATYVVDMLLQKCPRAKVIVVHDSDWCSVIRDSDNDWVTTFQDLQYRVQEAFSIVEEENGVVYLQEKMGTSRQLGPPSRISVKLEDEDLPSLGDRKPGFSQLFDSFEIPPLDMKADSPSQFFKKLVDDWNDDIKPNVYHDPGRDDDDDLGDEDNPVPDAAFLEFISRQIQKMKDNYSLKESSSPPQSADDCDDDSGSDSGERHFEFDMDRKDSLWTNPFLESISFQIQKMKNNFFFKYTSPPADDCDEDYTSNKGHDSSKDPFKLDANDLDNKHRVMLNALFQQMKNNNTTFKASFSSQPIKILADDAKPNLFDEADDADLKSTMGFVRRDTELDLRTPSDDEDYPMSDASFPEPTSSLHKQKNAYMDGAMFDDNFSASSQPATASFGGSFAQSDSSYRAATENVSHRDPESFTHVRETHRRIPTIFYDDRDDTMARRSGYRNPREYPSQPGPSSFRGSFAQLDANDSGGTSSAPLGFMNDIGIHTGLRNPHPIEAFPSTDALTFPLVTPRKLAAAAKRRTGPARFSCPLCPQMFTTGRNLEHHHNSHFRIQAHFCERCNKNFSTKSSRIQHQKKCM